MFLFFYNMKFFRVLVLGNNIGFFVDFCVCMLRNKWEGLGNKWEGLDFKYFKMIY